MSEGTIRLILADDHPTVRAGIRQFIERTRGSRSWPRLTTARRPWNWCGGYRPDVVMLDLQMPRLSGLDASGGYAANTRT